MTLKEQDLIPDLTLPTDDGEKFSLHDAQGRYMVIYFYPKGDTPGCTTESCDFRDMHQDFITKNVVVIGVSKDSVKSHDKFKLKHNLPFPLLSDESLEMCEAFGVWVEKSMYGKKYMGIDRSTFLINPEGKIEKIWRKVKVTNHVQEVIKAIP